MLDINKESLLRKGLASPAPKKKKEEKTEDEEEEYEEGAGALAAEERAVGQVKWSIISYYIGIVGFFSAIAICVCSLLGQARAFNVASHTPSLTYSVYNADFEHSKRLLPQ